MQTMNPVSNLELLSSQHGRPQVDMLSKLLAEATEESGARATVQVLVALGMTCLTQLASLNGAATSSSRIDATTQLTTLLQTLIACALHPLTSVATLTFELWGELGLAAATAGNREVLAATLKVLTQRCILHGLQPNDSVLRANEVGEAIERLQSAEIVKDCVAAAGAAGTVRVFRQKFALADAIGVNWHSSRLFTPLTG
jgi:hypothetical protein